MIKLTKKLENKYFIDNLTEEKKTLTLKNLAKEVQEVLREGIAIVYFWKEGIGWKHIELWYEDPTEETFSNEDNKIIDSIFKKDRFAICLDGYNCFAAYNLNYIQWRIKNAYEKNREVLIND